MNKFVFVLFGLMIFACKNSNQTKKPILETPSRVEVLQDAFTISKLNRKRTVRIYLPPNYDSNLEKKYPVLYMHDAQNLFEDLTSFVGEWHVDETLDSLSKHNILELIVVGIDHGNEKRLEELTPWTNEKYGGGKGAEYIDFIVEDLKPYIDENYRTLSDAEYTGIMGSSLGGLISHYAVIKYPNVYGKAGIFSPSYWFSDKVFEFTENHKIPNTTKISILVGEKEGEEMVKPSQRMIDLIQNHKNLRFEIDKNGEHNEQFWDKHFAESIRWLFSDYVLKDMDPSKELKVEEYGSE